MALPTTVFSGVGVHGDHPPFKSSAGNYYVVVKGGTAIMDVYKATDPTDSWTVQDTANRPSGSSAVRLYAVTQDGDDLHIIKANTFGLYIYHKFDMSANTWSITDETIEDVATDPTLEWLSIAVRSDGDVVVVYNGDTDQCMGGQKERVDVNIRTAGTWGGPVSLDAGGDIHYGNPNCVLGTNDFVHCLWQTTSNTTDPPTAWTGTEGRSLDPADDSLSTKVTSISDTGDNLLGWSNAVSYDDAGTQRIIVSGPSGSDELVNCRGIEDVNDEISSLSFPLELLTDEIFTNGEAGIISTAALNNDLHILYSGGGNAGVDQDLYYTTSTDDGSSWTTETEEIDAITVNFISANIYVRGADTVMAYVYDDGGAQKYNEKVLISGAVAPFLPYFPKRPSVLLRM